jgi:hypothetical protein
MVGSSDGRRAKSNRKSCVKQVRIILGKRYEGRSCSLYEGSCLLKKQSFWLYGQRTV